MIKQRILGDGLAVSALGLGCMGMSEFYGASDDDASLAVMARAVELGVDMFDTADIYGPHHNEELIGRFLAQTGAQVQIATKCGIRRQPGSYARSIDNSPAYIRAACEASLKRLGVGQIALFYLHRIERDRPIEEAMEALARLREEGKIAHIGLCEVSAKTLRRAHAVHPVAAVQTEYSLWTREAEGDVLPACRDLGVGFVAYSPLGRGFLTGSMAPGAGFAAGDFRASLPRFAPDNAAVNAALVDLLRQTAAAQGCTPAQLALAWVLAQGPDIVAIPGTRRLPYLEQNCAAAAIRLTGDDLAALTRAADALPVAGARYTEEGMKGVGV